MARERNDDAGFTSLVEYSRQPYFVLKFVALFLGIVLAVALALFQLSTLSTPDSLEAINIVVNVLLTGALILLYRDLSVIQDRQVRAMKASYTPLVGILAWEMVEQAFEEDSSSLSERLKLTLANEGNSMARDLRVRFAISYETADRDPRIRSKEVPLRRTEGQSWWHSDVGGSLPEGTNNVEFYTTPTFLHAQAGSKPDEAIRFDEAIELFAAAGIGDARLSLSLQYRNAAGEEAEIDFAVYELDVQHIRDDGARLKSAQSGRVSDAEEIKANAETVN